MLTDTLTVIVEAKPCPNECGNDVCPGQDYCSQRCASAYRNRRSWYEKRTGQMVPHGQPIPKLADWKPESEHYHRRNGGPRCKTHGCKTQLYWPGELLLGECFDCRTARRWQEHLTSGSDKTPARIHRAHVARG